MVVVGGIFSNDFLFSRGKIVGDKIAGSGRSIRIIGILTGIIDSIGTSPGIYAKGLLIRIGH